MIIGFPSIRKHFGSREFAWFLLHNFHWFANMVRRISLRQYRIAPCIRKGLAANSFCPYTSYEVDLDLDPLTEAQADGSRLGAICRRDTHERLAVVPHCARSNCYYGRPSCKHTLYWAVRLQRQNGTWHYELHHRLVLWAKEGFPCRPPLLHDWVVHHA